jgi:hypothetical protein
MVPIAGLGNFLHIYDFYVEKENVDEFIRLFNEFDYGDNNPMHKSPAQVKDGAMCQDVNDPTHFWLVGEWNDIEEHARIRKILANELKPAFVKLIKGNGFVPFYAKVVSATPQAILDKAEADKKAKAA